MRLWDKILTSVISISMLGWSPECSDGAGFNDSRLNSSVVENVEKTENIALLNLDNLSEFQKEAKKQIFLCLVADANSFTHTNVLGQVLDPQNTILEYPVAQLFQKYGNRNHPLAVSGVKRDFRALLWKGWIERFASKFPQKLVPRKEKITSDTKYELKDTLRVPLIDPLLKDDFSKYLPDQLKESWFEDFSDSENLSVSRIIANKKKNQNDKNKNLNFVYDIVVKKVPSWKSALALYRNGELFMATYVSVGLNNRKTKMWQFKILSKEPYKRSHKYGNAAMPDALNFYGGFYVHQWNVTWYPASHWCVRVPGVYADVLYSLVKNATSTDIFISKNLYNPQK